MLEKTKIIDIIVQMCTYRTLCVDICRKKSEIYTIKIQNSTSFDKKIFCAGAVFGFMCRDFKNRHNGKFIVPKHMDKMPFCARYCIFAKQTDVADTVPYFNAGLRF